MANAFARSSAAGKRHRTSRHLRTAVLFAAALFALFFLHETTSSFTVSNLTLPYSRSDTYDLPTLLNIPSFTANSKLRPDGSSVSHEAAAVAAKRPTSILSLYRAQPGICARQPYKPHLRAALARYAASPGRTRDPDEVFVKRNDTLLMQVVSGKLQKKNGTSLAAHFVKEALYRARLFRNVILLAVPGEGAGAEDARSDAAFFTGLLGDDDVEVRVRESRGTDADLYLMHIAAHLLVHRGSSSALGALVCDGKVYFTPEMEDYMGQNQYRWLVSDGKPAVDVNVFVHKAALNAMGPVTSTCCELESFGIGDGEKIICSNAKRFTKKPCWIISIGCGNRWSFEFSVVEKTDCKIHTFDCTGVFTIPPEIKKRVTLHKICIGQENDPRKEFMGWNQMIEMGARLSGAGADKMPALAKMDVEGHEFPVLSSLVADGKDSMLPEQLALELHSTTRRDVGPPFFKKAPTSSNTMVSDETIGSLFQNLSTRGYRLIHRADNPFCAHCSEVTLLRTGGLPSVK